MRPQQTAGTPFEHGREWSAHQLWYADGTCRKHAGPASCSEDLAVCYSNAIHVLHKKQENILEGQIQGMIGVDES